MSSLCLCRRLSMRQPSQKSCPAGRKTICSCMDWTDPHLCPQLKGHLRMAHRSAYLCSRLCKTSESFQYLRLTDLQRDDNALEEAFAVLACLFPDEVSHPCHICGVQGCIDLIQHKEGRRLKLVDGKQQCQGRDGLQQDSGGLRTAAASV